MTSDPEQSYSEPQPPVPSERHKQRDHIIRLWLLTIAGTDLVYGGIYAVGGAANSPAQVLLRDVMPMPLWGVLTIAIAGLLAGHRYVAAGVMGGSVWCAYATTSLISVFQGTAQSSSGPALLLGIAALHLLITYGADLWPSKGE